MVIVPIKINSLNFNPALSLALPLKWRDFLSALLNAREENPHSRALYQELEQLHRELGDVEAARMWQRWVARVTPAD